MENFDFASNSLMLDYKEEFVRHFHREHELFRRGLRELIERAVNKAFQEEDRTTYIVLFNAMRAKELISDAEWECSVKFNYITSLVLNTAPSKDGSEIILSFDGESLLESSCDITRQVNTSFKRNQIVADSVLDEAIISFSRVYSAITGIKN